MDKFSIAHFKKVYHITEEDLADRERIGVYISSYANIVIERFYNDYISQEETFDRYVSSENVSRLTHTLSDFLVFLFTAPFDQQWINRCMRVGEVHFAIRLQPIHLSRGFDILNEIFVDLAVINKGLRSNLGVLIKFIRIAEFVMHQQYYEEYAREDTKSDGKKTPLELFEIVYTAFRVYHKNYDLITRFRNHPDPGGQADVLRRQIQTDGKKCSFYTTLAGASGYQEMLTSLGIDFEEILLLHNQWHELYDRIISGVEKGVPLHKLEEDLNIFDTLSNRLFSVLDKPLQDMASLSFLAVNSGIRFIHGMTDMLFHKNVVMFNASSAADSEEL